MQVYFVDNLSTQLVILIESFRNVSWCMRLSKWKEFLFVTNVIVQTPHPQRWHFCGVALKLKMAFIAVVWQRSGGGKLWAFLQAFMLSLLVGGRSAFGTARLPVWGQLNTAWDRALKACPVRSEVLCVFVCVRACICVCVGASVCNALIKFDEPAMLRGPKIPVQLLFEFLFRNNAFLLYLTC